MNFLRKIFLRLKNKYLKFYDYRYRNPIIYLHPKGDFISDQIRHNKTYYELPLLHFLRKNCDCSLFIDVGANIGNHSKFFSEQGSKVFSIEPIKKNFLLLKKNVPNSNAFNVAVGDCNTTLKFTTYQNAMGNSNSQFVFKDNKKKIWGEGLDEEIVQCVPIDDLQLPLCNLLKIDVEGSEMRCLKGAKKMLEKSKFMKICIELHSDEILKSGQFEYTQNDIISYLGEYGFNNIKNIDGTHFLFSKKSKRN
jgi:FkbM family methyltransferase